jgi:hypothetical protein
MRVCKFCSLNEFDIKFPTKGIICNKCRYKLYLEQQKDKVFIIPENYKKICTICKLELPAKDFKIRNASFDKLAPHCRICDSQKYQKYYEENKESIVKRTTEYAQDPKNYNNIRQKSRIRQAKRLKNDPQYRISRAARCRINSILHSYNLKDSTSSRELLGCSGEELRNHLESQFKPRMTWKNYGSYWHMDHIIPVNRFDLTNTGEKMKAFNYKNLRPLPAIENMARRDQITFDESVPEFEDFITSLNFTKESNLVFIKDSIKIIYTREITDTELFERNSLQNKIGEIRIITIFSNEWLLNKRKVVNFIKSLQN